MANTKAIKSNDYFNHSCKLCQYWQFNGDHDGSDLVKHHRESQIPSASRCRVNPPTHKGWPTSGENEWCGALKVDSRFGAGVNDNLESLKRVICEATGR